MAQTNQNDQPDHAENEYSIGKQFLLFNHIDSAKLHLSRALTASTINQDTIRSVLIRNELAGIALLEGSLDKMLEYYLASSQLLQKRGLCDSLRIENQYNLGRVMYYLNLKQEAMSRLLVVYDESKDCHNKSFTQKSATSIAALHCESGMLDSSSHYLAIALKLLDERKDFAELSRTYSILAEVSLRTGSEDKKSADYCLQAKRFAELSNKDELIAFAEIKFCLYYESLEEYEPAFEHLKIAEKYYRNAKSKSGIIYALDRQAFVLSRLGKSDEVYKTINVYNQLKDSVYRNDLATQVAAMRILYETKRKEQENLELSRTNQLQQSQLESEKQKRITQVVAFALIILLMVLLTVYLISRNRLKQKVKYQKKLTEEQRKLFQSVVEAEEKERGRIAQELHDGIGQLLSTAKLHATALTEELSSQIRPLAMKSTAMLDQAVDEVRTISHNLMPASLGRSGLKVAIENLANQINEALQLVVKYNLNGLDIKLPASMEVTIFRIVQELINNAIKHASATLLTLNISQANKTLWIKISDNGKGFSYQGREKENGMGLKSIHSRVTLLNGKIDITSGPDKGTQVTIEVPIAKLA